MQVTVYTRRTSDGGWMAVIDIPMTPPSMRAGLAAPGRGVISPKAQTMQVRAKRPGKAQAAAAAAKGARKLLDNPVIRAALPPGVGPALMAVQALASSKKARELVAKHGKAGINMLKKVFA